MAVGAACAARLEKLLGGELSRSISHCLLYWSFVTFGHLLQRFMIRNPAGCVLAGPGFAFKPRQKGGPGW